MEGTRKVYILLVNDRRLPIDFSVLLNRNHVIETPFGDLNFEKVNNTFVYIWDTDLNYLDVIPRSKIPDVIVLFIVNSHCPDYMKEYIFDVISDYQYHHPEVNVLLVGMKDNKLKMEDDFFTIEPLDPFLAKCFEAVNEYKTVGPVHKVIVEAVRCSMTKSMVHVIYAMNDLHVEFSEFLKLYLEALHVLRIPDKPYFKQDLDLLLENSVRIPSQIQKDLCADVFIQMLEFDRLRISHALAGKHFNVSDNSPPTSILWYDHECRRITDSFQIAQCQLFNVLAETCKDLLRSKCAANLRFFANDCNSVASFLVSSRRQISVRSITIVNCSGTLDFSFLARLTGLEYLIVVNTDVDLASLTFPPHLHHTMKHLVLNNCGITQATDVPPQIGKLENLEILNLVNNNFKKIPTSLCALDQLHTLLIDRNNVSFPPLEVLRPARDIINYLRAIEENPVAIAESKLIVVGQEGVGKTTLVKAMKRSRWLTKNEPPPKTDGVDISVLPLKDIQCKVYDLAGDVEYLNTHSLFLSSNTLHLVVFDQSRVIVDKEARSVDHLCRLELWLQTIASQDPKSNVILVGTHADHPLVNREIIEKNRKLLAEVLIKHCLSHRAFCQTDPSDECFICEPEKCPEKLECLNRLMMDTSRKEHSNNASNTISSQIPHILGYFEVSSIKKYPSSLLSFQNINVEGLKCLTASSICNIMKTTGNDKIPERWLSFCDSIAEKLSSDDDLKEQPLMPLSRVQKIALKLKIPQKKRVVAMLRFFHSQGTYLWYEDLPEMRDIVILDPQWLSDQLRTLISHRPSVSSIGGGVLHLSELSAVWPQMSDDNRRNLLTLFRSVGLCFSISETEELFPCKLPVGWPDREIWPPVPSRGENQTSLLFEFSFVPPSFFSDLIVEVNKQKETFARKVKPLYYRFHIVYIRKGQRLRTCTSLDEDPLQPDANEAEDVCLPTQDPLVLHTIHYELMPYNNSISVAVRGPDPPSIIPDIRRTIETVKRRRYPGITYVESMLCPVCVMKRVQPPDLFKYDDPQDGVCSRGHKVGNSLDIFSGRYSSTEIVPSAIAQTGRVVGETLEDHFCPKLFVVLPINLEGLSLKDRLVYSYIRDGYAVHLLCECPGKWHFVDSPGFRVGKPKEFFEKYGNRVCKALRFISTLSTPMKSAATLDPHCKIGAAVGAGAESVSKSLESLLDSYLDKYPHLKPSLGSSKDDLKDLKKSSGLQRSELSRLLEVDAKGRNFGPLVCTYVDKRDEWLWLCEEHNERFEIIERENENQT